MPLFSLPLLGILAVSLAAEQKPVIAIVSEDNNELIHNVTQKIKDTILSIASSNKLSVSVIVLDDLETAVTNNSIDVILYLPKGFAENLTSIDRVAYYRILERLGSATIRISENMARAAIASLSREVSEKRVTYISEKAGLRVSPEIILEPVREYAPPQPVGPRGEEVSPEMSLRAELARFLMFALFFVVTPATVFISDSIIGERERKTFEMTFASPVDPRSVLLGKLLASTLLGIIASLADIAGVVFYLAILSGIAHAMLDFKLVLLHSLDVALTVFMTTLILVPIVSRAESIRSAQTTSSLITMVALAVYFSVLFVDIARLPELIRYTLYLIPYTHSVLAIYYYVVLQPVKAMMHLGIITIISIVLIYVSLRFFDLEKIVMHRERAIET